MELEKKYVKELKENNALRETIKSMSSQLHNLLGERSSTKHSLTKVKSFILDQERVYTEIIRKKERKIASLIKSYDGLKELSTPRVESSPSFEAEYAELNSIRTVLENTMKLEISDIESRQDECPNKSRKLKLETSTSI